MALKQTCLILILAGGHVLAAEESFCDNLCLGGGLVTSRSCYCDKACIIYNDCCADSKYLEVNKTDVVTSRDVICKRNVLAVNSCSKEWKGPDFIIKSCTTSSKHQVDPVGDAQVTSITTGVTYSNYHCAICNGDAENVVVWNIQMSCPLLNQNLSFMDKEEAFKYIFYNHPTNEWGYVLRDDDTKKMSFHGCALSSEIPEEHATKVRHCDTEEVTSCAKSWKLDTVKNMCNSYSDPVFSNGTQYKNFYCAICNRVDQSTLNCGEAIRPRTNKQPESDDKNKLSFSLLLDINFSEGNSVGQRVAAVSCLKGEIFDPFARRCRNIVCGVPGFIIQNGLCVPDPERPL